MSSNPKNNHLLDLLSLDFLKKNCIKIHSFGLGFIQIKLNKEERIHIYTPDVKKTSSQEEIHDHRYGFKPIILKGELTNIIYYSTIDENGTHILSNESCDPGKPKISNDFKNCSIKKLLSFISKEGSSYEIEKDTFHRVEASRCITYLKRDIPSKEYAQVIYEKEIKPTCPFSVNMNEEDLWEIVEKELASY